MNLKAQERVIKRVLKNPINSIYAENNIQYVLNQHRLFKFKTVLDFPESRVYDIQSFIDKFKINKELIPLPTLKEIKAYISEVKKKADSTRDYMYTYELYLNNKTINIDSRFLRDILEVMPTVKLYCKDPLKPLYGIDDEGNECVVCTIKRLKE